MSLKPKSWSSATTSSAETVCSFRATVRSLALQVQGRSQGSAWVVASCGNWQRQAPYLDAAKDRNTSAASCRACLDEAENVMFVPAALMHLAMPDMGSTTPAAAVAGLVLAPASI